MRESKRYEEMNTSRVYLVWVTVGEIVIQSSVQSPLLFCGITKVVSNGVGLFCSAEVILAAISPKAHCGKPRSPASCIAIFSSFARVFTVALPLVMDLRKRSPKESSKVDGPLSLLSFSLREQG